MVIMAGRYLLITAESGTDSVVNHCIQSIFEITEMEIDLKQGQDSRQVISAGRCLDETGGHPHIR